MSSLWVIKPYEDGFLGVEAYRKRGRWEFSAVQELKPSELKGRWVVALETSSRIYFSRETFQKGPKEVLVLQAEDKVREEGFFTEAFRIALSKLSEGSATIEVGILAVESGALDRLIETLLEARARVKAVYHQAMALAFLVGLFAEGPVLSVLVSPEGLWLTVTEEGGLFYQRFQEADEFLGLEGLSIEDSISSVTDYYHRFFGKTIRGVFPCGPKRELVPRMENLEVVSPDLSQIRAPKEDLLQHPELFGAVFVPEGYNLLPETERFLVKNLRWVSRAAGVLLALALINTGLWGYFYRQNRGLEAEILIIRKTLERNLSEIQRNYPLPQVENLKRYLKLKGDFERQPRMDEFLWWLAGNIPPGIKIEALEVLKKGGTYEVVLDLFFNEEAILARRIFLDLFDRIKERGRILSTDFRYDEARRRAKAKIRLSL